MSTNCTIAYNNVVGAGAIGGGLFVDAGAFTVNNTYRRPLKTPAAAAPCPAMTSITPFPPAAQYP